MINLKWFWVIQYTSTFFNVTYAIAQLYSSNTQLYFANTLNNSILLDIHLHSSMLHMQLHNCTVQIHNCTLQIHLTTVFFLIYYIYIIQCYICNCTIVQFKYTMYFANTLITENTINSILLVLYVKICVKLILIIHV